MKTAALFLCLIGLCALNSCKSFEEYPAEPIITYEGFSLIRNPVSGIDERGVLQFSFTDGDGDMGLGPADTTGVFKYNLFVTYFEQNNGVWEEVFLTSYNAATQSFDTINLHGRIPYLAQSDGASGLRGLISDTLPVYNYQSSADTVKFKAYIKDRAQHQSNTIETEPIIVKKQF